MKRELERTKALLFFLGIFFGSPLDASEQIDLANLGHAMLGVETKEGVYYIVRRSEDEQRLLLEKYGAGALRSGHKNFMLIPAISPDSDCALLHVIKDDPEFSNHPISQVGGFLDQCSCAWFDLTGRRQSDGGSGDNLDIAPHRFLEKEVVIIGAK